jgi:hypothetical protein
LAAQSNHQMRASIIHLHMYWARTQRVEYADYVASITESKEQGALDLPLRTGRHIIPVSPHEKEVSVLTLATLSPRILLQAERRGRTRRTSY